MGGSERKSKEKRKNRRAASSSEDEKRSKRPRAAEDEERESRRRDKREKRKEKKSHKHSKRDSEKKSKDILKGKHHRDDHPLRAKIEELSEEDYFLKNNEFATWLKDEKNVYFSDLSSESARKLFSDFVELWNDQRLESRYYEGISSGPRTSHNWKIKG
ncbi:luc7-like protein 3 [Cucurbita pepo subsp. pepo]|uniref:luc7-like protein 3 n=1 Tax=Cucurbita pepo subsp. pepo TaxID=3664 RepID=UPI000C9D83ED|nr:luc7-like protein 3 [Cucurbita pepo subsp. pepo]